MSQSKHSTWIIALVGIISAIGLSLALTGCNRLPRPLSRQLNNRPSSIPAVCTR
jgi:hypothetical protein